MQSSSFESDWGFPTPTAAWAVGTTLAGWFAAALAASLAGAFATPADQPPVATLAAVILPIAAFVGLYNSLPAFRSLVLGLDLRPLVLLHAFRTVGLGFIFVAALGGLPWVFAIPAGLGDAAAAVGALVVGLALFSRAGASRQFIGAWNAFGLADFIVAVVIGTLARSGGSLHFAGTPPSDALGVFPVALIPAFAVPLYVITHLIVALQLRARGSDTTRIRIGE